MNIFRELFGTDKPMIGVIHLLPLPGSPRWDGQIDSICQRAEEEAIALTTGGADGIIIENFFDAPFKKDRLDAVTISTFTLAVKSVMVLTNKPIGINCLRNDGLAALAIAVATKAQFIRVNVFTGAMVTDQGIIEGNANQLLLNRQHLGASKTIKIFADILVKHASPLGLDNNIAHIAEETKNRALADALIVSGTSTGSPPTMEDLQSVRGALPNCPLLIGSGINKNNVSNMLKVADGGIVGTSLKRQGRLENPIDVERVRELKSTFADSIDLIKNDTLRSR